MSIGPWNAPLTKIPAGGLQGINGVGLTESMGVELNAEYAQTSSGRQGNQPNG